MLQILHSHPSFVISEAGRNEVQIKIHVLHIMYARQFKLYELFDDGILFRPCPAHNFCCVYGVSVCCIRSRANGANNANATTSRTVSGGTQAPVLACCDVAPPSPTKAMRA